MAALQEKVVMGKGLGFQVKVGAEVDAARIEKVFALEQADRVATAVPEGVDSIPPPSSIKCARSWSPKPDSACTCPFTIA